MGSPATLRPVFLLTDFGLEDAYVGVMKAVLRRHRPTITIDDLCHVVAPQDIRQAAYQLFIALPYLPREALCVVVVDPEVGTRRRILLHKWGERLFLSPDNGIVDQAFEFLAAWGGEPNPELGVATVSRQQVSPRGPERRLPAVPFASTFDGRDVFMPLAALYAPLSAVSDVEWQPRPLDPRSALPAQTANGEIVGQILLYDHFGNAVTNLPLAYWPYSPPFRDGDHMPWRIQIGPGRPVPFADSYSVGPENRPFALCNSSGLLEIAIKNGSYRRFAEKHSSRPDTVPVRLIPVG